MVGWDLNFVKTTKRIDRNMDGDFKERERKGDKENCIGAIDVINLLKW